MTTQAIKCSTCTFAMNVMGDSADLRRLVSAASTKEASCPQCDSTGTLAAVDTWINGDAHELEATEAYSAIHGLGLPEERKCTINEVLAVLRSGPVKNIAAVPINNDLRGSRVVVQYLEMENGTRLYFGAGPGGAVIYRIRRKDAFTRGALNDPTVDLPDISNGALHR